MKARLPKGYGKQGMQDMIQQAQVIQEKMAEKQEELHATEYAGTAGGGMVEVKMMGDHKVTAIKINPEIVSADDVEMLEDMVAAAVNEAVRVVDETSEAEMSAVSGGMELPGIS